jgi:hypothetical protein
MKIRQKLAGRSVPAAATLVARIRSKRLFSSLRTFFAIPDAFLFWKKVKDKSVQPGLVNLCPLRVGADEKYGG